MRSAPAYPKYGFNICLWDENSGLHTRLATGVCFDIWFLGASPLRGVGLSAPIYFAALRKFRCNPLCGRSGKRGGALGLPDVSEAQSRPACEA
jgi:hypothetical protein